MRSSVTAALGRRLRELRLQRGLTQEALAAEAEMDRSYVGGIERGERNPGLVNLQRLAAALGVDLSTLFKGLK